MILSNPWHGISYKLVMKPRVRLNIWRHNDTMTSQVELEGITLPATLALHDLKIDVPEKELQRTANTKTVARRRLHAKSDASGVNPCLECRSSERPEFPWACTTLVPICEQRSIGRRVVEDDVCGEGCDWIRYA